MTVRSCPTCRATGKVGGTHRGFPARVKCLRCNGRGFVGVARGEVVHTVVTTDGVVLSGDVDGDHEVHALLAISEETGEEIVLGTEALGGAKALLVAAAIQHGGGR